MDNEQRPLNDAELLALYGTRKVPVGKAFKTGDGHYFLQRNFDVLHINGLDLINTLYVACLNDKENIAPDIVEITEQEFELKMKEVIYHMGIDYYWKVNS